jgi:DNA-directed RNA polymerase specialized sigma24 family protein
MHDEPQYYTPQKVRYWLDRYPALAIAVQYGTGLGRGDLCSGTGRMEVPVYAVRAAPGVDANIDPRYYRAPSRSGLVHDLLTLAMTVKVDLDRGIEHLPDREQTVIVLRYCQEWTVREVAQKTGRSIGWVHEATQNGVNKIARKLGYTQ